MSSGLVLQLFSWSSFGICPACCLLVFQTLVLTRPKSKKLPYTYPKRGIRVHPRAFLYMCPDTSRHRCRHPCLDVSAWLGGAGWRGVYGRRGVFFVRWVWLAGNAGKFFPSGADQS